MSVNSSTWKLWTPEPKRLKTPVRTRASQRLEGETSSWTSFRKDLLPSSVGVFQVSSHYFSARSIFQIRKTDWNERTWNTVFKLICWVPFFTDYYREPTSWVLLQRSGCFNSHELKRQIIFSTYILSRVYFKKETFIDGFTTGVFFTVVIITVVVFKKQQSWIKKWFSLRIENESSTNDRLIYFLYIYKIRNKLSF